MREYMQDRELSSDPEIREIAHFEGHLTPEQYHKIITRTIPPEDINMMRSMGYHIIEFGRFNWNKVIEAFKIYKSNFGNLNIPYDYVIDSNVIESQIGYDESFEDMLLGEIVHGLHIGDIDGYEHDSRRAQLDELGFEWSDMSLYLRFRFVPMIFGLKVYRHLYGFAMPQFDFVIPDNSPQWPYWMYGMPLGEWAAIARVQQKLIDEHYPDRKDMLTAMEFLWWIPPGPIASKYYEPLI
jgi:hypothetical protein